MITKCNCPICVRARDINMIVEDLRDPNLKVLVPALREKIATTIEKLHDELLHAEFEVDCLAYQRNKNDKQS